MAAEEAPGHLKMEKENKNVKLKKGYHLLVYIVFSNANETIAPSEWPITVSIS